MKKPRRSRTIGFVLAAALVPVFVFALSTAVPTVAVADQTNNYQVSSLYNQSDPDIEKCFLPKTGFGYCLYTSQDMSTGPQDCNAQGLQCQNIYPMDETLGFFSTDGLNWTAEGNRDGVVGGIFNESAYVTAGWTPAPNSNNPLGTDHLWAPNVVQGDDGDYYLYDPDVWNTAPGQEDVDSFIGVSQSTSGPFGPFTPMTGATRGVITGTPGLNGGYASDPDVFKDTNGTRYIVMANGDFNNCGSLSIGTMPSMWQANSPTPITINGIGSALGDCTYNTGLQSSQPYEEGPSLYNTSSWGTGVPGPYLLVFAAKPTSTPSGCTTDVGQPGSPDEVIAYATATSPTGPYTYGGVLMCGSGTEWTDQASLAQIGTSSGTAIVMYYHDGQSGNDPKRQVHATCLAFGGGKFAAGMRPVNLFNGLYDNLGDCASGSLKQWGFQAPNGTMISATVSPDQLAYSNRIAAGEYEGFTVFVGGTNTAPNQYIGTSGTITATVEADNAGSFSNAVAALSGSNILSALSPFGTTVPLVLSYNSTTKTESATLDHGTVMSDGTVRSGSWSPTVFTLMRYYS